MGKEAVQDALQLVHSRHLDLEKETILVILGVTVHRERSQKRSLEETYG